MNSRVLYGPSFWAQKSNPFPPHALAVVIDVLRATSTMIAAFSSGVNEIFPCASLSEARALKSESPRVCLAGEIHGIRIDGFNFGNSPQEFLDLSMVDFNLAMFTTNGTKALKSTLGAAKVIVASFLNEAVVTEKISQWNGPVVYICAGTGGDFSLEDAVVAGSILNQLEPTHPLASLYRSTSDNLPSAFRQSKNGAHLVRIGMESDIDITLQRNRFPILPYYNARQGVIRLIDATNE